MRPTKKQIKCMKWVKRKEKIQMMKKMIHRTRCMVEECIKPIMKLVLLVSLLGVHFAYAGVYTDRFLQQYNKLHDSANGYFSKEGIPYHSSETLLVDAPDYGHQTTSEAFSYWIWLEAVNGRVSGDYSKFNSAWDTLEKWIIPSHADQSTNNYYNSWAPATYADELAEPSQYPSPMQFGVPVGQDPIYQELVNAYGTSDIYSMNWLLDVDNIYGFGNTPGGGCSLGPNTNQPSFMNSYQRGPMESVWRTIPQTTCDLFKYGGIHGFLDLFVGDNSYAQQWKFSTAPDGDARAIQGTYWAYVWASESGQESEIAESLTKASKMGDYLRYAMFDKYFKKVGNCIGPSNCPGGQGKESAHYLLSWYSAWGGSIYQNWAWRIGDGAAHFGYQNPLTAYALSTVDVLKPKAATAVEDWSTSLQRQLEFYAWLQSSEGAFGGGATNTWEGKYGTPPDELLTNTFHGMFYDWEPVYHDPPSNRWYGMQPWSTDRLAQYYYVSKDETVRPILDKWVQWIIPEIKFDGDSYLHPDTLDWSGNPPDVHCTVLTYSTDVGTATATARTLAYYAAATGDANAKSVAKELLDRVWNNYQTTKGVSAPEIMETYSQFNEPVYVPAGWMGSYPYGDVIQSGATFISLRSWYKNDPDYPKVQAYLDGGDAPEFTYHRFWQQADVAIAQGTYGILFDE